jgi:hypothetical protein
MDIQVNIDLGFKITGSAFDELSDTFIVLFDCDVDYYGGLSKSGRGRITDAALSFARNCGRPISFNLRTSGSFKTYAMPGHIFLFPVDYDFIGVNKYKLVDVELLEASKVSIVE